MGAKGLAGAVLALSVFAALVLQVPSQFGDASDAAEVARSWDRPDEQYRAILGDVPYDLLRLADAALPRDAVVLLVTPGSNVRHREYTMFHRALYFLAPRPVHWITPAPGDGTWEARWWRTAPTTAASICAEARRTGATHILLLDLGAPTPPCPEAAWDIRPLPGGTLVALQLPAAGATAESAGSGLTPAWPLQLALALAVPLLLGGALVAAFLWWDPRLTGVHRLVLAWIFGTGAVTLLEFGLGALGVPREMRMAALLALAVVAGVVAWQATGRRRAPALPHRARLRSIGPVTGALLVVIGAQVALVALLALGRPLSIWDGWAVWGMKARAIFLDGGVTETIYADPTRASTLLDYPLHVPLLESWVYTWLGTPDDRLVGVIGTATFASLLGFCYAAMRRWGATLAASLAVAAVIGAIPFVWRIAAGGFADVAVALLLTVAAVHLVAWLEDGARGDLLIAVAAAGLLGWTKKEGLVLWIVLIIVVGLVAVVGRDDGLRRRARRAVPALLLGGIVLSGGWWLFVIVNGVEDVTYGPLLPAIVESAGRIPTILSMLAAMLVWREWSYVWVVAAVLAAIALVQFVRSSRPRGVSAMSVLPATAALSLVALSAAFIATTFEPYTAQIESAGYRLALQVLPITVLWIGRRIWTGSEDPSRVGHADEGIRPSGSAPAAAEPSAPSRAVAGQA